MMYGSGTKIGKQMGNTEPGDGFKYRGRGNVQLTGKSNYAAASKAIYGDNRLVDNPDLVNDPAVAAEVTAWYMQKGQQGMAKSLGINTKNMSQDEANQLATSQIAGRAIKRGEKGYLGGEVLDKVDKFSKDSKIAGIAGAPVSEETKKAMAEGKPKPQDGKTETKPESGKTSEDTKRTATAEGKPAAGEAPSGTLQGLIKDGIVPTTIAFQDLVNKGIKPFQGMMSGVQAKTPLDAKKAEEARTEAAAKDPRRVDQGTVKPEDSLKKGEEIVKDKPSAQGKPTETYTINGKPASKEEFDKFMKDNPELAKMMGKASGAPAQARDPGTGELLSSAKDLTRSLSIPSEDMNKTFEAMANLSKQDMSFETALFKKKEASDISFNQDMINGLDLTTTTLTTSLSDSFSAFENFESVLTDMPQALADSATASNDEIKSTRDDMWSRADDILEKAEAEGRAMTEDEKAQRAALFQAGNTLSEKMNANFAEISNKSTNIAASETPKAEIVAAAEKEAADKIRAAEEAAQAEKDRLANQTVMAGSQDGAQSGASDLNTALAELIAINRKTAELNEKQLSVQSSLSGDLFA
jgi:hypothetical protein